jgi:hypothetical protein
VSGSGGSDMREVIGSQAVESAPTALRQRPRYVRRPRLAPIGFASAVLASALAGLLAEDWIAGAALWVLWAGWRYLRSGDGPPVIALAFTFQWVQVMAGVYYYAATGRRLPAMDVSDYRTMVLLGLGCLLALLLGIRSGMWLSQRLGLGPARGPERAFGWAALVAFYILSVALTGTVQEFAWEIPALTQAILALTYARFALLFLMFRRLSRPNVRWGWIALILAGEIALGFTGYFAGFREPMMMAAVALTAAFDRRRPSHWVALGALAAVTLLTGVLWMGIRTEYRRDFESQVFAESREARLERIAGLSSRWARRGVDDMLSDVEFFVDRLWAVHYPALAVARVPALVPHEDGAILRRAVTHLITPRLFFADKEALESDSEMVFRYSGVMVAGAGWRMAGLEKDTNIAFGYAGESYVDFGVPFMFIPVFVYGVLMGLVYRWLQSLISHRELAVALVTVVFWLSLYLFERSWVKTLGLSATLILYLGGATLVLDRFLLWRLRVRTGAARGRSRAPSVATLPPES